MWRLAGDTLAKTPVTLGERDARLGNVVIASGIAAGDRAAAHAGLHADQRPEFEMAKPAAPAASVAPGA